MLPLHSVPLALERMLLLMLPEMLSFDTAAPNPAVAVLPAKVEKVMSNDEPPKETPPPKKTMSAGETIIFRARLAAAPEISHDVKVRFAGIDTPSK